MSHYSSHRNLIRNLIIWSLSLFVIQVYVATALAQGTSATLSGTIVDQNNAAIPGASVTVTNNATRQKRETFTDDRGYFTVPLLLPAAYTVNVQREGFAPIEVSNVTLNVGDQKSLMIQLKAGNISEMVKIEADAPLLNDSPAVGTVVDRQFVANLPLNGRSFQSLISLSPGVVLTKASGGNIGQFSVNGQRPNANYFTVDGVSANIGISGGAGTLNETAGGSLPGLMATGGTNGLVSVDALQEFKIQTSSYAPEFGRSPGAQVQLVTRSGGNTFTGSLFEYFRNDALDSNDWFGNSNRLPKPPLKLNQFGGIFGGPLVKDRTFFFFSYEGLRLRQPTINIATVFSNGVRQSTPAPLRPFLAVFPAPNGPELLNANGNPTGLAQYAASYSNPSIFDATSFRIDQTFSDRFTLFGRYNYSPSEASLRQRNPSNVRTAVIRAHTLTLGATWIMSSSASNELRANYSRNQINDSSTLDSLGGATPLNLSALIPSSASPDSAFFSFFLSPEVSYSVGPFGRNVQRQVNLVDNLSIVYGGHQLKFGIDYRRLTPISDPRKYVQLISFSGVGLTAPGVSPPLGTILSGTASSAVIQSTARVDFLFNNLSAYGQDTWKASRRLTLTYGLRWELNPPPKSTNGNDLFTVQGLDNLATLTIAPRGTPLYRTTYNNFAPRLGVAFQLSRRQNLETVVRGGFGVFFDLGTGTVANGAAGFPYNKSIARTPPPVALPLTPVQAAAPSISLDPPYGSVTGVADPNLKLPRILQWNFAIEQGLGARQSIAATYVGAAGRRLLIVERLGGPGLNPNFTSINISRNTGRSDYHSLQLQFIRRLSRRLQGLASYTWGNSIDNASQDVFVGPPQERIAPQQNRGPSDFDVRHAFNAALTYDLPTPKWRGFIEALFQQWSVDAIFTARTATPVDVTSVRNIGFGALLFRPDLVQGVPLYLDDSTVGGGRRINRAAFVVPTVLRQGTLGRNSLRGFSIWQADLGLRRKVDLSERLKLLLKAEVFNIFNHPNFADPDGNLANATFGQSTQMFGRGLGSTLILTGLNPAFQMGGPRSIQLSVKLSF
jgi:hypothetical protein